MALNVPSQGQQNWAGTLNAALLTLDGKAEAPRVVSAAEFGIDSTGVVDAGGLLNSAIAALPAGYTLKVPTGTYRISTPLSVSVTRSIDIDFSNSTLIHDAGNTNLASFVGGYDTPVDISALSRTTIPASSATTGWASSDTPGVTFTTASAASWKRGDLVKVVSDTPLAGQRDLGTAQEDPAAQARYGQHLEVFSVSGTTVTLVGELREADQYLAGLRAARMRTDATLTLRNAHVTVSDADLASDSKNPTGISFVGLYRPILENVQVDRIQGYVLQFRGCYRYTVRGCTVRLARDRITGTNTNFGYGILDSGSEFGSISDYHASHVRHAFTDDSSRGGTGRDVALYGRTFGTQIANSSCEGSTAAAWDTHAHGDSITFSNVGAYGCAIGFRLRGIRHSVRGAQIRDSLGGVHILDEGSAWGWSWGHSISDVDMWNTQRPILNYVHDGGTLNNVLETRPSWFSNITIRGCRDQVLSARNTITFISDLYVEGVQMTAAGGLGLFYAFRAQVNIARAVIDLAGLSAVPTQPVFGSNQSEYRVDDYTVMFASAYAPTALYTGGSAVSTLSRGVLWGPLPSTTTSDATSVSWRVPNARAGGVTGQSAGYLVITDASVVPSWDLVPAVATAFLEADATTIVVSATITSAVTIDKIPRGRAIGQRLLFSVVSGSTAALTLTHGATARTSLRGSANVAVTVNLEIELIWNGSVWVQTYAV